MPSSRDKKGAAPAASKAKPPAPAPAAPAQPPADASASNAPAASASPPQPPAAPPAAGKAKTVHMTRDPELHPVGPHKADVHPEEVDNYAQHGWVRSE